VHYASYLHALACVVQNARVNFVANVCQWSQIASGTKNYEDRGGEKEGEVLINDNSPGSPYLLHLALQTMKSSSAPLALSTWRNYLRCVQKAIEFTTKHGVVCFPVVNTQSLRGAMFWFQHWRQIGTSWSSMRTFRSAWKSCYEALRFLDPWIATPALARQTAGLQKQVSVFARPRVDLTIVMLKAVLAYMDLNERLSRASGNHHAADVLLRDAVALMIDFFAMRRSDELFMNKTQAHGILQAHVVLAVKKTIFSECLAPNSFELINELKPRKARFQKTVRSAVFFLSGVSREILKTRH